MSEKIVWEEHLGISKEQLSVGPMGAAVPFSFHVPFECQETTDEDSDNRILWILTVTATTKTGDQPTRESYRPIQDSSPNDAGRRQGVLLSRRPESICRGLTQRLFSALGQRHLVPTLSMQSGGRNGTAYYQIRLVRHSGRDVVAGEQIRDKPEAEWLVEEIKTSLGL